MRAEKKLINNLRKATSPKMVMRLNLLMLFLFGAFVYETAIYWRLCKKFMDASGITFSEIINIDYKSSFTGLEVGTIESYHHALRMLITLRIEFPEPCFEYKKYLQLDTS